VTGSGSVERRKMPKKPVAWQKWEVKSQPILAVFAVISHTE